MEAKVIPESDKGKTQEHITAIQLSAVIDLLIEKKIFTREEFGRKVKEKLKESELIKLLLYSIPGKSVAIPIEDPEKKRRKI